MPELLNSRISPENFSKDDLNAATELIEEGHSPADVRNLITGGNEQITEFNVEGIATPVISIDERTVTDSIAKNLVTKRILHESAETYRNDNNR